MPSSFTGTRVVVPATIDESKRKIVVVEPTPVVEPIPEKAPEPETEPAIERVPSSESPGGMVRKPTRKSLGIALTGNVGNGMDKEEVKEFFEKFLGVCRELIQHARIIKDTLSKQSYDDMFEEAKKTAEGTLGRSGVFQGYFLFFLIFF